jgi:hypothetical protein
VHDGHVVPCPPPGKTSQPVEPSGTDRLADEGSGFRQDHSSHPLELRTRNVPCDLFGHPEHFLGVAVDSRPAALANKIDHLRVSRAADQIASLHNQVGTHSIQISDDRFERCQIPVDLRDDCRASLDLFCGYSADTRIAHQM